MTRTDPCGYRPAVPRQYTASEMAGLFAVRDARVLLAEDNITNQQVALGIMKKLGLAVDTVANGAEAIAALESTSYDLVFMDLQMPVMGGYAATEAIRRGNSKVLDRNVLIIAMTAGAMQGDREKCLAAGMNGYISKPITPQTVSETLKKWLLIETRDKETRNVKPGESVMAAKASNTKTAELILDSTGLFERMMDDGGLVKAILEGFLQDIPDQIQALKKCLATGDIPCAERQAHSIKGAAANVSGEAVRAVALEVEEAGRTGDLDAARARMGELEAQSELLKEAIIEAHLT